MSALKRNNSATQSAPTWPLTPKTLRQNPRLPFPVNKIVVPKFKQIEEVKESFDLKPDVDKSNAVFIADTWLALAPVKFEPRVELDPRQAPDEDDDNSFEETFTGRIAGVRRVSASSFPQSVESVEVPPNTLGPVTTPQQRGRPKGSKNRRRDPVVDLDAPQEVMTPRKFAGAHDNMALC